MQRKNGFTLIELIMVIIILGILAVVAMPFYFNLQDEANDAAEAGVIGGIRAGIATEHADSLVNAGIDDFIAALDGVVTNLPISCSAVTAGEGACFDAVLDQGGITDSVWSKENLTTYRHVGSNTSDYVYTQGDGSFLCDDTDAAAECP